MAPGPIAKAIAKARRYGRGLDCRARVSGGLSRAFFRASSEVSMDGSQ